MSPRRWTRTDRISSIRHDAEQLSGSLPPLLVAAERVASTVYQGVHGRRRTGQGETFWQFRRYEYGDSVHLIDWRQSAKSDPLYVREAELEAAQSVWLWRDCSRSMSFKSAIDLEMKRERADLFVMALASLLVRGGERVALMGKEMRPGSGRAILNRIWNLIEEVQEKPSGLPPPEPLPRYARVVMVGDFLSPLDKIEETVGRFAGQGLRGHLVQVLDPAEERLPYSGKVLFDGPEGEGEVMISRVESLRNDYMVEFGNHCSGLHDLCRRFGWSFTTHRTDQPPERSLMALYMQLAEISSA